MSVRGVEIVKRGYENVMYHEYLDSSLGGGDPGHDYNWVIVCAFFYIGVDVGWYAMPLWKPHDLARETIGNAARAG